MKTDYLLENFNKNRFRHYSKKKLDSLNNRYMRVLYAVCVIISDFFKIIIPKIFKNIIYIPIYLLDSIFEAFELWATFIKIAYYWDRLKDEKETYNNAEGV